MSDTATLEESFVTESLPAPSAPTVGAHLSGIIDDVQKLVRLQLDMLKAEFKEELTRTKRASAFGGLGMVMMTVGGLTLVASLVNFMHEHFQFSMWGSCLIIGGALFAIGVAVAAVAWSFFERFNPLPEKSIKALQENLTWTPQPQT